MPGKMWNGSRMSSDTAERLYQELEAIHPGKVRRVVEVCPVAVLKTIDNEEDAQQTLDNIASRRLSKLGDAQNQNKGHPS